jgi:hypothetical protein
MNRFDRFSEKLGLLFEKLKKVGLRDEKRKISLFLAVYFLILFLPAWRNAKLWSDDWAIYWDTNSSGTEVMNATVSNGRPILGWLLKGA